MGRRLGVPGGEGDVLAVDGVRRELGLERLARLGGPRDHHDAARSLVEPVDDARPDMLVLLDLEVTPREKTVDERACLASGSGMNHETRGLHEDDEGVVDVEHVEAHGGIGGHVGPRGLERVGLHARPDAHDVRGLGHFTVERHPSGGNPPLDLGPRDARLPREEAVDPLAAADGYQRRDLMCPFALMRMSTSARS